jgi:hypothetical protein
MLLVYANPSNVMDPEFAWQMGLTAARTKAKESYY